MEFSDEDFKPANPRTPGAGADPSGNMRPMMDLGEVDRHNDQIPVAKPQYGRGPSQDSKDRGQPKPVLDPEPNYASFQMSPNVATPAERRVVIEVTRTDPQDAKDEAATEILGPASLED